jgi:hypothetical protein
MVRPYPGPVAGTGMSRQALDMSSFSVNTKSLQAMEELLLACAAELSNAQYSTGPGHSARPDDVLDSINGAWPKLSLVLGLYGGMLENSGKNVEQIAGVLKAAITHYERADQTVASAAGGPRA